jgi:recombination associated protein RdgC
MVIDMFKNAVIYRIAGLPATAETLAEALAPHAYAPCTPGQERGEGWAPPRGEQHGALVESIGGQWIARYAIETRIVPADAVRKRAEEKAAEIERAHGRKPGSKEMRELREDARAALLKWTFSRTRRVWAWIDRQRGRLVIDTAVQSVADAVVTALVRAMPELKPRLLQTEASPRACMAAWLTDPDSWLSSKAAARRGLRLERACELRSLHDEPERIRFNNHDLSAPEVREYVQRGLQPVSLEMSRAGRVAFTLTQHRHLRGIALLYDAVAKDYQDPAADRFDADAALATGELRALIDALIAALGGEPPATPPSKHQEHNHD